MNIFLQEIQIGHFHPLIVHLPIGIIILGFALELFNRFFAKKPSDELVKFTLGLGAITAVFSLGTGWLLGEEGGFDEDLLFLHRWMAVAFTITTILLFFLKSTTSEILKNTYIPTFIVAIVLISITGHYGGNMTHGEDYLFRESNNTIKLISDIDEAQVHADIIQPILEAKCVSCHNQSKIKGGLLMTSPQDLLKGGDTGSLFDSIENRPLLLHRIHLPLAIEEHMPPKGKVQLTEAEIALIEWWLENENCFDCKTKDLKTSKNLDNILASLEQDNSPRALIAQKVEAVPNSWLETLNSSKITVSALSEGNPLLIAQLFGEQKQLEKKLHALEDYADNIVELNLGNSQFNDTIANKIAKFKHLTKLQLQNTAITDKSIRVFKELEFLESLNLYGTSVTKAVFDVIKNKASLKSIYLYDTQVSIAEIEQFQAEFPKIRVQHIPTDAFKAVALSPPTIIAASTFFKDSLQITIDNTFEGSKTFYTLDGSAPDSTSIAYKTPFKIHKTSKIQAIVLKSGWDPSEISSENFIKVGVDYVDISLNKPPNDKYRGQEGLTLIDLKRGTTNFVDGNWLGYEANHFNATLTLSKPTTISKVSVGALSAPASYIFYPIGITVYTSENGTQFKRVKTLKIPKEEPNIDVSLAFFDLEIPPTTAKYLRVEIKSPLKNPEWHTNPGEKSWIFVDEIVLN